MTVYVQHDPPIAVDEVGHLVARSADGVDAVEIRLRYGAGSTRRALLLLARASIEVCVRAREVTP